MADGTAMEPLEEVATVTAGKGNGDGMIDGLNYGRPFTEDELTQAMSRSTLKGPIAGAA